MHHHIFSLALQLLHVNHKAALRFAAIRTLNTLSITHPEAVFPCNLDLENLITDSNRSISTFAITTLLKVFLQGFSIITYSTLTRFI